MSEEQANPPVETPESAPLSAEQPEPTARVARGWRPLRWVAIVLLSLILVVLGGLGVVFGTQGGLRAGIELAERLAPGMLSVGRADGRVLGSLHLEDVAVKLPTLELRLGALDLDWSPATLFSGLVRINRLAVRDLDVALAPTPEEDPEPLALPTIVVPLRFEISEAQLDQLRIHQMGSESPGFVLEQAALSVQLEGSELRLESLAARLRHPALSLRAQGRAGLVGHYPHGLDLDWELNLPPDARLTGEGRLSGDLRRMDLEHRLLGSVEADLEARILNVLDRPSWDGRIQVRRVDLPAFQADLPQVETSARLETRGDLDEATLAGTLDAKAPNLPDFGHLGLKLDLLWKERRLAIRDLEMTEQVSEADLRLKGELDLAATPGRFDLEGDWKRLRWPLSGELLAQSPQGSLKASGDFEDFVYRLSAEALGPSFPSARVDLRGKGTASGTRLESLALDTLDGRVEGEGDLTWAPALAWDLTLRGKDLNPGVFVKGLDDRLVLDLKSKGNLDGFDYDLAATSSGSGLPPASLALAGQGDLKRAELERLRLDILDGRIEGRATLDLAPKLGWEATLAITGIDPGAYAPEWPGRIDGRLTSQGFLEEAGPTLTAVIEDLKGTLRGYPIAATGKFLMQGQTARIEGLTAASGPSQARVEGQVAETLDLRFDLESPDLASLLPKARGRLTAKGQVQGASASPKIKLDFEARDVAFEENGIAELAGTADLDLATNGRFSARLDGKTLAAGAMRWEQVELRGEGVMADHQLSASLSGEPLSIKLAASGGLREGGGYAGRLATLNIGSKDLGDWSLQRPASLSLEGARLAAGPLCLRQTQGSGGCLEFDQTKAGQWNAVVDLDRLDFALLKGFLPENLTAEGAGRVKGRFRAEGATLTGTASVEIPQGRIWLDTGRKAREELDFSSTRLTLETGANGLSARLGLPLKDLGRVDGDLNLPGWNLKAPASPNQTLRGGLRADLKNLSRVSTLVPDISGLTGGIDSDLNLVGTLGRPGVTGQLRVRDVNFQVPLIALGVKNLNLTAEAPALGRFDIRGQAEVGGGTLDLTGASRLDADGQHVQLRIEGDKLKVANTKEYFALVSPRVDIELGSEGAVVRGEIRVPEARIRPKSVPAGTVSPSSDVVLRETDPKAAFPLLIDMRLVLGDEVTIDAFGVRGRLSGSLAVLQSPGKEMLGDGQLQITDGEYRLTGGLGIAAELGAPLTITQGRLIYAKSPIGNPGLLLQAEREGGDTAAGVRLVGTLRNPKMTFFSENDPGMTQADITKYLMTGIPPSANDKTDQAGLAVGTYIAPKIYMEYESGLGDEANKIKLRYDLSKHIELQTETGESQGADVFLKFEN
ncbi:translocation/assembly module TamB domain-containing protein [Thiocystis violacea]|uniref:translocation/assembly module TamB domain-containing protein n=1 Tax=Thiocystis violacea TaxID=13725 RepID=UPI001F5BBFB7|nr:translocation/assembly module TamB domain-containing protein [Thiocystis violacea]MBK1717709.1 translocation/assembly module TamB [Thiocystis violacea]